MTASRKGRSRAAGSAGRRSWARRSAARRPYAGTVAANVARSDETARERLETRHIGRPEDGLGARGDEGGGDEDRPMASFIDIDLLPPEYREIYQRNLAKLRTHAPAMPWEKVREVMTDEYEGRSPEQVFASIEKEAFAAASIGQVHRATLGTRAGWRSRSSTRDRRRAGVRHGERGHPRAPGQGARPQARRQGCRRGAPASVSSRSSTTSTRPRTSAPSRYDDPFIYVPKVHSRLAGGCW